MTLPRFLQPCLEPLRRNVDKGIEIRRCKVEASAGSGDQGDGSKLSLDVLSRTRELVC